MGAEGLGVLLVVLGIGVLGYGEEVLERVGLSGGKGIGKERPKERAGSGVVDGEVGLFGVGVAVKRLERGAEKECVVS